LVIACNKKTNLTSEQITVAEDFETSISIPIGENSWIGGESTENKNKAERSLITAEGIKNWEDSDQKIETHIRFEGEGKAHIAIKAKATSPTNLTVAVGSQLAEVEINNKEFELIPVGTFTISDEAYQTIQFSLNKENESAIDISELEIGGPVAEKDINFVADNFHFGRRGPSVHLRYPIPDSLEKPLYFYNEVVVPEGEDVIGSYYMANGFTHGYFGIQANSENERRILFSVWSPYDTQDPKEIPEDQQIKLLKKGPDVQVGEFGNEGSGGQSFRKFMWKTDTTYKFLLKGEPYDEDHTDYTAYFYNPEEEEWELIASFRRPKASNYLGSLYSFLENFVPSTGNITREANYKNQWLYDKNEGWIPLTNAEFTADATANQKHRLDYAGGEVSEGYYLKNCGFFDDYTEDNTKFSRKITKEEPSVNLEELP